MLEFVNKVINPEKPWLFMPDTIENIINDLEHYTLDPVFEKYGNFIYKPTFKTEEQKQNFIDKYGENAYMISGNFYTLSHAFYLVTDEQNIIDILQTAINKNKQTEAYKQAKQHREEAEAEYQRQVSERINKANRRTA
jgi:hypothetical protein